jgi:hypothetical protein
MPERTTAEIIEPSAADDTYRKLKYMPSVTRLTDMNE